MPEIVIGKLRIFPRLTDIHRHPASICQEFRPAVIAVDCTLVFVSRNGSAYGKARRDADGARQCNKVSVEIRAVAGVRITGVHGVTTSPTIARVVVTHSAHYVIIE